MKRPRLAAPGLLVAAILALSSAAAARPPHAPPTPDQAIAAYGAAIRSAETSRRWRAIEHAFGALATLRETLVQVGDDHRTALETLSDVELDRLRHELPGVLLHREQTVRVEPDYPYFSALAARLGDPADRAFFETLAATYPDSVWPVYVDPRADLGGCVRFGSLALVDTYQAWSTFRRKYPGRYSEAAGREGDKVALELAQATCACDSMPEVERELEQFVERFPRSPVTPAIEQRLLDLRAGRTTIHAHCIPG